MVAQYRQRLEQALSLDRLAVYAPANNDDLQTVTNYFWNIALCQELYPCLGSLEVTVRTSIHSTLSGHFRRADWYDTPGVLQTRERKNVADAKSKIKAAGKQVTPGRVVAALHFGFWTSLLDNLYGNSPAGPRIWKSPSSVLLISAFPNAPGYARGVRRPIFNQLDDIRRLRNRVFHYERIYHGVELPSRRRGAPPRQVPLAQMHTVIVDVTGWVDPTLQATVQHLDGFIQEHRVGEARIEGKIKNHLGIRDRR